MTAHYDEDDDNDGYGDGDDDVDDDDKTHMFISDTYLWCFIYTHIDAINYIYRINCLTILKFKIHTGQHHLYIRANIELHLMSKLSFISGRDPIYLFFQSIRR